MPILGFSAAMALLVTLAGSPARPPSAEEQKAFAEGLRLYQAGDARGAEQAWKAGYAAGHDPAFLVRIGEAEEKAGAPREAVQTYQQYLRESPDAADRADIEARLDRLMPPGERKSPAAPVPGGTPTDETPGVMRGGPQPAASATKPAATAPLPAALQARDDSNRDDEELRPLFGEGANRSALNVTAWVGVGVTTLLLGTAVFFGASAADKASDANRLLTYGQAKTGVPQEYAARADQYEEDLRVGRRDDRLAKGFLIAAGATAVASTILFIVDGAKSTPKGDSSAARGTRTSPTAVTRSGFTGSPLGLSWSF